MNAVVKGFDWDERGQLIMACGTGKTLTALFISEKVAAERTLVLVPSLSLLAKTLRELSGVRIGLRTAGHLVGRCGSGRGGVRPWPW